MSDEITTKGQEVGEVLSAPLEDIIASVGAGVAKAQTALDRGSMESFRAMQQEDTATLAELKMMGCRPTWFRIPEVHAELVMSLSVDRTTLTSAGGGTVPTLYATPIDANYVNKFGFSLQASTKMSFKIVPVPPPPNSEEVRFVPALKTKTFTEAKALLELANIQYEAVWSQDGSNAANAADATLVHSTSPAAGQMLPKEQKVTLTLEQEG